MWNTKYHSKVESLSFSEHLYACLRLASCCMGKVWKPAEFIEYNCHVGLLKDIISLMIQVRYMKTKS